MKVNRMVIALCSVVSIFSLAASIRAETRFVRGSILHFLDDPSQVGRESPAYQYFSDGLLEIKDGVVVSVGEYNPELLAAKQTVLDYRGKLILPGFIDTHIHYPQTEMIAAYGEQLLEWLETYTFPTEQKFKDKSYASKIADFFLRELFKNGTTSALVFGTVHRESVDALFEKAASVNMRLIAGKVMMDRNAPDYLLDTADSSYKESKELLKKWHRRGRALYAITPRFAPTSTPEQLAVAGKLKKEYPDAYVHTHLSENLNEIEWVKSLFPERQGYFDVYDFYGLSGKRSIFAHSIHLNDDEWHRMAATDSVISFCPTSNLFLGSGLFDLKRAQENAIRVGLGTDVGAGTSFSMLETLNEAYKVSQLRGQKLSAWQGLYLATLGGAKALDIDAYVGNFQVGKEADFVVLDWSASELQRLRQSSANGLEDQLFALMMLGDDRNVLATYVSGELVYKR